MAMTDDEKLLSIETWADFKTLISSITKTKVKTFIKNGLQKEVDRRNQSAVDETETADNLEALKDEINLI